MKTQIKLFTTKYVNTYIYINDINLYEIQSTLNQ